MKAKKSKSPHVNKPGLTISALSIRTGHDPKTLKKLIHKLGIQPVGKSRGFPIYPVEPIDQALAQKPDKTLKEEKLSQEVRKLRIANDVSEGRLIRRDLIASTASKFLAESARMLTQSLENEFPALVQGLDIAGCRTKGKQLNDRIRAELSKLCETWPE